MQVVAARFRALLERDTAGVISLSFAVELSRSKSVRVVGEGGEHKVMTDPMPI